MKSMHIFRLLVIVLLVLIVSWINTSINHTTNLRSSDESVSLEPTIQQTLVFPGSELNISTKISTSDRNVAKTVMGKNELTSMFPEVDQPTLNMINKCPDLVRPLEDLENKKWRGWHYIHWHDKEDTAHTDYFYSAIYDTRQASGPIPTVRVLGVGSEPQKLNLFCQVWFKGLSYPYIVRVTYTKHAGGHIVEGKYYGQYYLTCRFEDLPDMILLPPEFISIVKDSCDVPQNFVPVNIPSNDKGWEVEFGACVSITYWDIDPIRIAEWVEMNNLLGVSEINLYISDLSNRTQAMLDYYRDMGIVKLHPMTTPIVGGDVSEDAIMLMSAVVLNDCMWRNMYKYRYMVVTDIDEIIVPSENITYHHLLIEIDKANHMIEPAASYTFRNTYHWVGCSETGTGPRNGSFLFSYNRREPHNIFLYGGKSILDPRRCMSVFNHYCLVLMPRMPEPWTIDVLPGLALNRHYRTKNRKDTCAEINARMTIRDLTMARYKGIQKSVQKALEQISQK